MTAQKQLKARIRARMARTGESYTTARRHVAGSAAPAAVHAGYRLRGGVEPVSASLAAVLAHYGVRAAGAEIGEALLFGVAGGPGACYILWEFAHDDSRPVALGFEAHGNYIDRAPLAALHRLGIPVEVGRTGGAVGASRALAAAVDSGAPALVWPDRYVAGYRHLPATLDGMGGHAVVAYGREPGGHYLVDDRGLAPLTVPAAQLDAARARVGSYRNLLLVVGPDGDVGEAALRSAVRAGVADIGTHLGGRSTSFALPAWRKWARLMTDERAAKGWPRVFADGRGLASALASVWEGASAAGMTGGHLRGLTAEFVEAAADVLGVDLGAAAGAWRAAATAWTEVADAALPVEVAQFARLRELTATIQQSLVAGDAGRAEAAAAAAQLWALRAELDVDPPLTAAQRTEVFGAVGERLHRVHAAEVAAVAELGAARIG